MERIPVSLGAELLEQQPAGVIEDERVDDSESLPGSKHLLPLNGADRMVSPINDVDHHLGAGEAI
jgi:hypothetical protein